MDPHLEELARWNEYAVVVFPIEHLHRINAPPVLANILRNIGCKTIGDLFRMSEEKLFGVSNMGPRDFVRILRLTKALGFRFGMEFSIDYEKRTMEIVQWGTLPESLHKKLLGRDW